MTESAQPTVPVPASIPEAVAGPPDKSFAVEGWILAVILLIMTVLPVVQAISRKLFGNDLAGAAVYVQHGTLWVGFLGALLATARGRHLGLSTVEMLPEGLIGRARASSARW